MASFQKFNVFVEHLAKGVHQLHAAGHTLKVYLSNTAPSKSADAVKADLAEITNENGYTAPVDVQNDISRDGGRLSVTGVDFNVTASGGTVGPFRYVVLYNDSASGDPLIGWWDYGVPVTLADGEIFKVDFGTSMLTIT